jgi:hypothetical protein
LFKGIFGIDYCKLEGFDERYIFLKKRGGTAKAEDIRGAGYWKTMCQCVDVSIRQFADMLRSSFTLSFII